MNTHLSGQAQTVVTLACLFIFFLNLGLVFAYLRRSRDSAGLKSARRRARMPWESKLDEQSAELARRVAALQNQKNQAKDKDQRPPD